MNKSAPRSEYALERRRAVLIGLALLCCYSYFFYLGGNWNIESHYAQIFALAEHGTLVIDDYPFLPPGGGDAARYQGRYYSDKLIGPSLVAVPFYAAVRRVLSAVGLPFRTSVYLSLRVTNVLANSLPSALLVALLYLFLAGLGLDPRLRVWLVFTYGLGTLAFPYSTVFFGHQLAAVSIAFAFMLLWRQREEWSNRRALAAGALAGFAAISDAMGIFVAIFLGVYAIWLGTQQRDGFIRRLLPFAVIALAIFAIQLTANWVSFGNPLTFPHIYHAQEAFRARHRAGFFGLHAPQLYPLYQLTIGPWRGLFYGSPVLLLTFPGLYLLGRTRRAEALLISAAYLWVVLLNSGYENWTTGSVYGPRYQIVTLALLIIAAAPAAQKWPHIFRILALISIAFTAIVTAQTPFLPEDLRNPLANAIQQFTQGNLLQGNLGMVVGLQGIRSLAPLAVIEAALFYLMHLRR